VLSWLKRRYGEDIDYSEHDYRCLRTATEIASLWVLGDLDKRRLSAAAFGLVVAQMRPGAWQLAFQVPAYVGDWGHRLELWTQAGLPTLSWVQAAASKT
jgi:hypothetical protein